VGGSESRPTPYRDAAPAYYRHGWTGTLPLPYGRKKSPPERWTGHGAPYPSFADIQAWVDSDQANEGRGNIALRMPPDLLGIDVDQYAGKNGGRSLAARIAEWGPLPKTWRSTSRDDGVSGISFYRVPEGLRWRGQVGPDIETIHSGHRYAVVWPSVHPEGRTYRWYRPDGMATTAIPRVEELPWLPDAWVLGLTDGGQLAEEVRHADLGDNEVTTWIVSHTYGAEPCSGMAAVRDNLLSEMHTGSAHESLRRLMGLVRFAEQGHVGLFQVLHEVHARFIAMATSRGRSEIEAELEWQRSRDGAVRRVLGMPSMGDGQVPDPCTNPLGQFAGLIDPSEPVQAQVVARQDFVGLPAVSPPVSPGPPAPAPALDSDAVVVDLPDAGRTDHDALGTDMPGSVLDDPTGVEVPKVERSSWWPRDLREVLHGGGEPEPVHLLRSDGQPLFYAGRVNGLLGESESGKTWIALEACKQAMLKGGSILYLDFEDSAAGIVSRFQALGVPDETIVEQLIYVDPEDNLNAQSQLDLREMLALHEYSIVVVDGINAAMTLFGFSIDSNTDATTMFQKFLKPLAKDERAVITIDHLPKSKEGRGKGGIGAQAKRAMTNGCCLTVDVVKPFGRGQTGQLKVVVDKNRAGHVRGATRDGETVGLATLNSNPDTGAVTVVIDPQETAERRAQQQREERGPWRPTMFMARISRMLEGIDGGLSANQIELSMSGRKSTIKQAIEQLVVEGFVITEPGPRGALLHRHARSFTEVEAPGDEQ
jgi:hypothetical protein